MYSLAVTVAMIALAGTAAAGDASAKDAGIQQEVIASHTTDPLAGLGIEVHDVNDNDAENENVSTDVESEKEQVEDTEEEKLPEGMVKVSSSASERTDLSVKPKYVDRVPFEQQLEADTKRYDIFENHDTPELSALSVKYVEAKAKIAKLRKKTAEAKAFMEEKIKNLESKDIREATEIDADSEIIDHLKAYDAALRKKYERALDTIGKLSADDKAKSEEIEKLKSAQASFRATARRAVKERHQGVLNDKTETHRLRLTVKELEEEKEKLELELEEQRRTLSETKAKFQDMARTAKANVKRYKKSRDAKLKEIKEENDKLKHLADHSTKLLPSMSQLMHENAHLKMTVQQLMQENHMIKMQQQMHEMMSANTAPIKPSESSEKKEEEAKADGGEETAAPAEEEGGEAAAPAEGGEAAAPAEGGEAGAEAASRR